MNQRFITVTVKYNAAIGFCVNAAMHFLHSNDSSKSVLFKVPNTLHMKERQDNICCVLRAHKHWI
jgi:hypothetical protein